MTRGRATSFWWLAAASTASLFVALDAALLTASRTLPCTWAGASWFGWDSSSGLACFMFGSHHPWVQWGVPLAALTLLVSMLAAGVVAAVRMTRRTRTAAAGLLVQAALPTTPKLIAVGREAGRARLLESPASEPWCFCIGWFRPTIVISRGFVDQLDMAQLRAVLAHERHHAERRDPLRLLVARTLSAAGYPIPSLRDLFASALLESELAADRAAIDASDRRSLAGALRIALASPPPPRLGVAFAAEDNSLVRAACLAGSTVRTRRWDRGRLAVSAAVLITAFVISVTVGPELAIHDTAATSGPADEGAVRAEGGMALPSTSQQRR